MIDLSAAKLDDEERENRCENREMPSWAIGAHALVLSHAHLDHSGNIPQLVKPKVGQVRRVALVHGEQKARDSLEQALKEHGVPEIIQAEKGARIEL